MADIAQLGFAIDSSGAVRATKNLDGMTAAAGRAGNAAGKLSGNMTATERSLASINKQLQQTTGWLGKFAAAFLSIQAARQVAALADSYTSLTSKLRNVTESEEALLRVRRQLYDISQETRQGYAATGELYARLTRATSQLNLTEAERLRITETINKAAIVSGATAQESENAIRQLSQGLAAGALRGEEFNSVAEQLPILLDMVAKATGRSRGELRVLAADGAITADVLVKSLAAGAEEVDRQFGNMEITIGQAVTVLQNAWLEGFGGANEAAGASAAVADAIVTIARAIELVAPQLNALAVSWRSADTEQGKVSDSAMRVANAMKTVVVGLILAKNTVDLLVGGFTFMVRIAISASKEIIGQFETVANALPKIWEALKDPGNIGDNIAGVFAGVLTEAGARLDRFNAEAMDGSKEFATVVTQTGLDVSTAFDLLNPPAVQAAANFDKIAESAGTGSGSVVQFGESADAAAKRTDDLAKANARLADMIGRVTGAIDPLNKVAEEFKKTERDLLAIQAKIVKLGGDEAKVTKLVSAAIAQAAKNRDAEVAAIQEKQGAVGQLIADMETELELIMMDERARNSAVAAMRAEEAMIDAINTAREAGKTISQDQADEHIKTARAMAIESEEAARLRGVIDSFEDVGFAGLLNKIDEIGEALQDAFGKAAPEEIAKMEAALGAARQEAVLFATDAIGQGIDGLKSMATEGSSAYKALETAQAALNVVTAIGAIANQGMGDPYTAFARIAAMIAAMSSLGLSVGGSAGGGGSSGAAARQEAQGTGTVLGDAEAKSESIMRATEITADATTELVGINQGMLRALNSLQAGIGSASGMLARGAGSVDVGPLASGTGGFLGSLPSFGLTDAIFGGKEELIDSGIVIMGGALNEMLNSITVGAYNTIETDGGWFSGDDVDTDVTDITDQFGTQFQLIIRSIVDTVREGALALGLLPADIQAALDAFAIAEIEISLKDLSAEEQAAELQAVFSSIFDDLAGSVVPFLDQFQRVGEGLGETLVRVATSVQVMQEAMTQLGLAIDVTDPEQFAQISVGLIDMAGGVDAFISGMQTFVNAFATEEHKFAVAQDAITRAFEQFGLTIPETRDGMWALMQSLDATTAAGQEQIAMLLRIAGVADDYYSTIEDRQQDAARAAQEAAQAAADAQAEAARVVGELIAGLMGKVSDGQRAIEEFDMSPLAIQLATIQRETADALATAAANGAGDVVQMTIAMTGMERAIIATRLAALEFNEQLGEWEFEDSLIGMTELERQIAQSDRVWQERLNQAIEIFGAESEEAARVTLLWGNATTRFTEAAAEAAETLIAYTTNLVAGRRNVQQILQEARIGVRGDGLTDQQRAISEINDRFEAYEQGLRDSLIGFSGNATARRLLEEQVAAGLIELDALRLEALQNLELEWLADIEAAVQERYQTELDAIRTIQEYLDGMLLGPDSPLSAEERTAEAWSQLQDAVASGNADEATRLADVYLRLLRESQASGDDFNSQFWAVRELLEGMRDGLVESVTNDATTQYLSDIAAGGMLQLHALDRMNAVMDAIAVALGAAPNAAPPPANAVVASGYAVSAGPNGEPAESEGMRMLSSKLETVVTELAGLRADVKAGSGQVATAVTTSAAASDRSLDVTLGRHMRDTGRTRSP